MAATSTNWGHGAHKMTADISSPAPVTSPSADSPIKAKSFSVVEGTAKEAQVPASSPTTTSFNGNSNEATAAAAAAAAAAAVAAATTTAKLTASSNGIGRVPTSASGALAGENVEDDGSEAAGTSSDSGDDDDDEDETGGSSSARGRRESEAGGAKAAQQTNGHHGPVQSTLSAGGNAGNGHVVVTPRPEVDEHAARASDAATAALMAALESAKRSPPAPRPPRPVSPKPTVAAPRSPTAEERPPVASVGGGRETGGGGIRDPVVMMFLVPRDWDDSLRVVSPQEVDRALAKAGFARPRSASPSPATETAGGEGGRGEGVDRAGEGRGALPLPLPSPTVSMPCMVGYFKVDEATGVHRCAGTWAMTKSDLEAAAKIETRASPFEFKTLGRTGGAASFPYTGNYQGHFLVRQPPKPVTKVDEDQLHLAFVENSGGGWNVQGNGRNVYGSFTITGRLGTDRRLEVYRAYPRPSNARGHRRPSVSSHGAAPPARKAPSTPAERGPARGKHPHSAPPRAPLPAVSHAMGNGASAMMAEDASLESPVPAGRRVSRTPSYLIKDIGNDGSSHLSHGLRRCLTVLKAIMGVRNKSEWFMEPVDHAKLGLADYPRIIKRPMDLGTVRKKLEGGKYQNTTAFAAEVRLVFSNARLYNSDPSSLVHVAAAELFELFESKFAALGPNLDDPPLKRKKSMGGANSSSNHQHSSSGSGSSHPAASSAPDPHHHDHEPERDRKRKSSGASKSNADAGGSGGGSATKKSRPAKPAKPAKVEPPPVVAAPAAAPPPPPAPAATEFADADMPPSMLMMQRRIAEMEAQILRMQGAAMPQPPVEPLKRQRSTGGAKRSKASGKAGGTSKGGGKTGGSSKGAKAKGGGSSRAGGAPSAAAERSSKAAAAAAAKAAKAEAEAQAAAAAAVPLTFDEKKALSVAINKLDQNNLTRVVEIIQNRMPLGSSDEEIELDIDSMDNLTLRDLQRFIMDVSSKGGSSRKGGDSDSDAETW